MLNCKEVVDLLSDYLAQEVSEELAEIRRHLKGCRKCTALLDSLKTTVEWTHKLEAEDIPPEVVDDLQTFLRSKIRPAIVNN